MYLKGAAFFAIKGDRFDGHDFASAALANGAGILIIAEEKIPAMGNLNAPMIVVGDVLAALEALGRAARRRVSGKVARGYGFCGQDHHEGNVAYRAHAIWKSSCFGCLI
ncbi:Mur ligase domain-containing protein [Psychrosphaera aquimarina]|uniref:Mur ligase domain-containing protein n=1 Tax=Psychrosphaera aquimarina TaxID=2044854 RepID=A0ABU3QZN1_9GAMM|nr:Mur ligase domain-containing protein [Psychrosphaera aquimarina]MDU0112610.1 Mur ligase domain-containing protein [Psychrosphaera aquimarina]